MTKAASPQRSTTLEVNISLAHVVIPAAWCTIGLLLPLRCSETEGDISMIRTVASAAFADYLNRQPFETDAFRSEHWKNGK